MPHQRLFLGWERPWAGLFAAWLAREPDRLRSRLVVVPTRQSGRRLREALLDEVARQGRPAALLGPRVSLPEDFFRPEQTMPDSLRWAGWFSVLAHTPNEQVAALFPTGLADKDAAWRLAVVRQIEQAREWLIGADLTPADVAARLSAETARWQELAALERRVAALWRSWGHDDPVAAKRARARQPVCPPGVEEIVVAGVPDPTPLAVEAWKRLAEQGISVTILVGAPEELAGSFDEWGRPRPEFWADRLRHTTPEPDESSVAADAVALAEAVVRACNGEANDRVAVGVCDATFRPAVAQRFCEAGLLTFDPEGVPLARDGWPELLEALACALERPGDATALTRLARHPVLWREGLADAGPQAALAVLDAWEQAHAGAGAAIETPGRSERAAERAAAELLGRARELATVIARDEARLEDWLRRQFRRDSEEIARRAWDEMAGWSRLRSLGFGLPERLRWLAAALAVLRRSAESDDAALALQGWLELPFDPAPHLILAGLHEGCVPESPPGNPLLSEALRETLGLRDRRTWLARDAFLYTAMIESRRAGGRVTVVTAQVDARGDPCRPSRLLLQAPPDQLAPRVLRLVREDDRPDVPLQPTPPWARGDWLLRPPAGARANKTWEHLSPSTLRAYLTCPTRFYFSHVLGWERVEPFEGELDARGFGDLLHSVLRVWGQDPDARELADAAALRDCWINLLRREARARFGSDPPPAVRLQLLSAEERLAALAPRQAEQRSQGWHVAEVELALPGALTLAGLPVRLRVDRIDRHEDGRVRVIDYKTGRNPDPPVKAHLRPWADDESAQPLGPVCQRNGRPCVWTDLQLPLYVAAVQRRWSLHTPPEAWYATLPEAVSETAFLPFDGLAELLNNALNWAEEAARRIVAGVFWPPAAEVRYDDWAEAAPEGLDKALGEEWAAFLGGGRDGACGGRT